MTMPRIILWVSLAALYVFAMYAAIGYLRAVVTSPLTVLP